jgi:hypothetical protein
MTVTNYTTVYNRKLKCATELRYYRLCIYLDICVILIQKRLFHWDTINIATGFGI